MHFCGKVKRAVLLREASRPRRASLAKAGKVQEKHIDILKYVNILIFNFKGCEMPKSKSILLDWEKVQRAADILKAVAHPTRLRIAELLQTREMTVGEIQESLGTSQSMTSQQLSLMKARGILKSRKAGKSVYYGVESPEVIQVLHCLKKC
jgi:DNA-binding transcriptional ArsR family regulator